MSKKLEQVVIEPSLPANYAVIWLHGLGADGHDFAPIVPQLQLPHDNIRFIFPHAPTIPVTINMGMPMPAWFDVKVLHREHGLDIEGAVKATNAIADLVKRQLEQGIPSEHIVLAGFSQGGVLALHAGLTYPEKLAGIIGLSTFIPHPNTFQVKLHEANQHTPIMMCHGTEDHIVPLHYATESAADLRNMGFEIEWHEYPMEHSVCPQEIVDISRFLQKVLK